MTNQINGTEAAIDWFRAASPYINAHRGKTLVICVPGSALRSELLPTLTHDLTLLSHIGLRLVLCFGIREQVDEQLAQTHIKGHIVAGRRVTDPQALSAIISAAGLVRNDLEARLSMGLPNTPMAGARLAVTSGNFVTAQPFGVHGGLDFQHTGSVREIHQNAIQALLNAGHLVLLPPLGYSLTGDVFNVTATEVASAAAIALKADKLVFLVNALPRDTDGSVVRQASANQIQKLYGVSEATVISQTEQSPDKEPEETAQGTGDTSLDQILGTAVQACLHGVQRVHLLANDNPDALLSELFTRDGSGTLITAERWDHIRPASISDVGGIIELITPLQANGTLVSRSREALELDIDRFVVSERDGMVVSCAAMYLEDDSSTAEIACMATHPDYRGQGRADQLLTHLEKQARRQSFRHARILSTHTGHWFIARGYSELALEDLPANRRASYNQARNSKIYQKRL
ncbi:amino-acid N-acetyltransferase [Granulosicoccus antarcticus]|uniref:Amino-acid acetyltransferase n=1 Tax=Granulosicoccus antarcticus IMCC3135 TaxID=1192854 RepID=A0A2Z2NLU9_9GAMM|nr:amino-acid N-acetyltransferase [Granulosicoccus antarcticus]ASJ72412.1 Amino-acid acetyltransferase [Granulosicoccus antarcticus IMCC3135]